MRLALVLDETHIGGVEVLLLNCSALSTHRVIRATLVCLRTAGPLADDFRDAGFEVVALDRSGRFDLATLPRLVGSCDGRQVDASW